jgi:dCMP deaminase
VNSRLSKTEYFLKMLDLVAARSTCIRRVVGAIITDSDGHILSTGYNGVPKNFDHCIDVPCAGGADKAGDTSRCLAVHAEQNALLQCNDLTRATILYSSCVPCKTCALMICNTEIKTIFAKERYADEKGLAILIEAGITVIVDGKEIDE